MPQSFNIEGYGPVEFPDDFTPQQIQQDKQVVQKINHTVGKSYVQVQKGLPDTIVVTGGGGGGATPGQSAAEKVGEP